MSKRPAALAAAVMLPSLLVACGTTGVEVDVVEADNSVLITDAAVLSLACSGCHGPNGGAIASLMGRTPEQIQQPLLRYRSDESGTSVMHRMMRGYSEADIEAISTYLAEGLPE